MEDEDEKEFDIEDEETKDKKDFDMKEDENNKVELDSDEDNEDKEDEFIASVRTETCDLNNCPLRCSFCGICLCELVCTCREFCMNFNFCLHSHLVGLKIREKNKPEKLIQVHKHSVIEDFDELPGYSPRKEVPLESDFNFRERLLDQLEEVRSLLSDCNLKIDNLKFNNIKRLLNECKTNIQQKVNTSLIDFINSPSKKVKMFHQERKY